MVTPDIAADRVCFCHVALFIAVHDIVTEKDKDETSQNVPVNVSRLRCSQKWKQVCGHVESVTSREVQRRVTVCVMCMRKPRWTDQCDNSTKLLASPVLVPSRLELKED